MKLIPRIVLIVILIATWIVLFLEHRAKIAALQDADMLRAQVSAAQSNLTDQNTRYKAREAELTRLRDATKEIYKLRGESAELKKQQGIVQQLKAENQQLRSNPNAATPAAIQNQNTGDMLAKDQWVFAGYATPEAALQSIAWAMREGDRKAMMSSVTEKELKRMEDHWNGKSDEEFRVDAQREMNDVTGMRILEKTMVSNDEAVLSVYSQGKGDWTKFSLIRSGNDWKFNGKAR